MGNIPSSNWKGAWRGCIDGARKLLAKDRINLGPGHLLSGRKERWKSFIMQIVYFPWGGGGGIKRTHVADYFIGASQKIPDWLIQLTFLVKIEKLKLG